MTRAYAIDLATGEATQLGPADAIGAATDDSYFIDPAALAQPATRRALGDIYQAIRSRRFTAAADPTPDAPAVN